MKKMIIKANGTNEVAEVGDGYEAWNKAIGARVGQIAYSPDGSVELWCDEEGLFAEEPKLNKFASMLVGQQIVGDVIAFERGDIT